MNTINPAAQNFIKARLQGKCDILMLTANDWSNTCYRFMKCLEMQKLNCIFIKLYKHIFNYPEQGIITNVKHTLVSKYPVVINIEDDNFIKLIFEIVKKVKYIWCHASTIFLFKNIPIFHFDIMKEKIFIVSHGGTTYREHPQLVGNIFNKFASKTLVQCPDLLDLNKSNKQEELIYYPVDLNVFTPNFSFKNKDKLVFGHNPSTSKTKGSNLIIETMKLFKEQLIYIGQQKEYSSHATEKERTDWKTQILKYKKYDIYIETINPYINNKPYGEWGNTCLEAIASGCLVITNSIHINKYIKWYQNVPPLFIANNKRELIHQIQKILSMSRDNILAEKHKQYEWLKKYHSMEKCSERLVKFIKK
tara:strand:- start:11265 stop:12353 length:1089 start_codon:yes stop_codon:yes gene_type:complete